MRNGVWHPEGELASFAGALTSGPPAAPRCRASALTRIAPPNGNVCFPPIADVQRGTSASAKIGVGRAQALSRHSPFADTA